MIENNLKKWLKEEGYDNYKTVSLGGKFPDVMSTKGGSLLAIEIKMHATEITTAIGQCFHYLQKANEVYIALPADEIKFVSKDTIKTLTECGIGLIFVNSTVKVAIKSKKIEKNNLSLINQIKEKNLTPSINVRIKEGAIRENIINLLKGHTEGLTILDIARYLNINRLTASKYIYGLISEGIVLERKIGSAKLCYLKKINGKTIKIVPILVSILFSISFGIFLSPVLAQQDCTATVGGSGTCNCCDTNSMTVTVTAPSGGGSSGPSTMTYSTQSGTCGSTPAVTRSYTYSLGYTFCPTEGQYTATLTASSAGGNTACGTYGSETSSSMNLYTVAWDTDSNWCGCKAGTGKYNSSAMSWEAGTPNCCGDDSNENKVSRSCTSGCTSSSSDWACCDAATDCVYSATCYANGYSGDVDSDSQNEKCSSGAWITDLPAWSSNTTSPSTPATYASGQNYQFNITWTDNVAVDEVILQFNSVNYSYKLGQLSKSGDVYYKTISDQPASTYSYKWYANDTSNNWNSTSTLIYTVNKATPTVNLLIDGAASDKTVINATQTNATGYENNAVDADVTYNLYRRNSTESILISSGSYVQDVSFLDQNVYYYIYNTSGGTNYTSNSVTRNLNVSAQDCTATVGGSGTCSCCDTNSMNATIYAPGGSSSTSAMTYSSQSGTCGGTSSATFQVGSSSDNCARRGSDNLFYVNCPGDPTLYSGDWSSGDYDWASGFRFTGVTIPQGATITSAYLTLNSAGVSGAIQQKFINGEAADNAATFSTAADYNGRTRTSASVSWTAGAWTSGTWYNSTDITTVVQEIVNRAGWTSGNAMALFWYDGTGWNGVQARMMAGSYCTGAANKLVVTWQAATSAATRSYTYTGYTFCPTEGTYNASLWVGSSGGNTACGTYGWEVSSNSTLYTVNYDTDSNWCGCKVGSGYYNSSAMSWEAGSPNCCGDDTNENKVTRSCTSGCTSSSSDWACCDAATDCVYSATCYANGYSGDVDSDGLNEKCNSGAWITVYPVYSSNTTSPSTPATYASGQNYQFNITWTDYLAVDEVILQFNSQNYSYKLGQLSKSGDVYYKTISDQPAATYSYKWYANDTSNNWNSSSTLSYTINQNTSTANYMNLTINGTESSKTYTYAYLLTSNATAWNSISQLTFTLFQNTTSIGTSNPVSDVKQFAPGAYNYTYYTAGNTNYSSATKQFNLVINKATPALNLLIDGAASDKTVINATQTNATGYETNSGDSDVTYSLYRSTSANTTTWWNTAFQYRKNITVSNTGSALTNYSINFTVTFVSGKMNSNFSDLRFADSTGSELSYWIENYTASTSANVWVRVSNILSGSSIVYMYYGNPSASSASNVTKTFLLFDNFEGTVSSWTIAWYRNQGTITAVASPDDGSTAIRVNEPNGLDGSCAGTDAYRNFTFDAAVNASENNVTIYGSGSGNGGQGLDYWFSYITLEPYNNDVSLGAQAFCLAQGTSFPYCSVNSGVWLTNNMKNQINLNAYWSNQLFNKMMVNIRNWACHSGGSATTIVDNLRFNKSAVPIPTTTIGTEETYTSTSMALIGSGSNVQDVVVLDPSVYSYIYNTSGGTNYTSSSVTRNLNVSAQDCTATVGGSGTCSCCDTNSMNATIYAPGGSSSTYAMTYSSQSGTCGTTPAATRSYTYTGYTFCPTEGTYNASLWVGSSGGNTACGTYGWEVSSNRTLYTVNYDTDSNWCGCKMGSGGSGSWANTSFDRCENITISNVGTSTLTNFPAYINLTYDSDMLSNYQDLRFYNASCSNSGTLLDYEIENYTASNANIWVRIPTLSTGSNTISVYYKNNTAVGSGQNATGVWDSNYKMVQHLKETSGTHYDSTSNGNNGTAYGGVIQGTTAKINGGDYFDGSNDYVDTGSDASLNPTNAITVEAWINPSSTTAARAVVKKADASAGYAFEYGTNTIRFWVYISGDNWKVSNEQSISTSTWYHVVGVYSGTQIITYKNGAYETPTSQTGSIASATNPLNIGRDPSNPSETGRYFVGTIDEVRVSNIARSADWINQSYQLVASQSSYVSFGSEQSQTVSASSYWNTSAVQWEAGSPNCCGDDSGENKVSRSCTSGCDSNSSDWACCDAATDCVYSATCYANGYGGDVNSDSYKEKCIGGSWISPCKYSSGNWNVNCSDDCTIITNYNLGGNNFILSNASGTGTFTVAANITNIGRWTIGGNCMVVISSGQRFG